MMSRVYYSLYGDHSLSAYSLRMRVTFCSSKINAEKLLASLQSSSCNVNSMLLENATADGLTCNGSLFLIYYALFKSKFKKALECVIQSIAVNTNL